MPDVSEWLRVFPICLYVQQVDPARNVRHREYVLM